MCLFSYELAVLTIEKKDIRATIALEPLFHGLQFKVFLSFNIQFQGFKVSNFSIQFPKFKIFLSLIVKSTAPGRNLQ
jgi:hypothetical protein